jgi:hypothetical protein
VRRDLGIRCPDRRGLPGHALRVALATRLRGDETSHQGPFLTIGALRTSIVLQKS